MSLVTLEECPIGLFTCKGELCLKTEYGSNEGRIDAYIVSSGEFFWGEEPQTISSQRAQLVQPVVVVSAVVNRQVPQITRSEFEEKVRECERYLGAKLTHNGKFLVP